MVEPGLFSEGGERRSSALPWTLALVAAALALALGYAILEISRVRRELAGEKARADGLVAALRQRPPAPPPPEEPARPPAPAPLDPLPPAPPGAAPLRAPDLRVLKGVPAPEAVSERLAAGLAEFRAGRYERAELQFFRAVPDSYLYLLLTSLVRGDTREALTFLARAAAADPAWFRKVRPRDLFGTEAEFERVLAALEARLRENPIDSEAKVLLAYLYYHEKGAPYAKALLAEVTNADPENREARGFLENLDR
jgi:tetratricopeptide (TPR) repeat protein